MSYSIINSSKPFMEKFHFVSTDMNHEIGLKKNVIHVNKKLEVKGVIFRNTIS